MLGVVVVFNVGIKHTEETHVGHRGALQLWNGGAPTRPGVETIQRQEALVYSVRYGAQRPDAL